MKERLNITIVALVCACCLRSVVADPSSLAPGPNPALAKIISPVSEDVTKIDAPVDATTRAPTSQPRKLDLALTVAKADPWTYPDLTMVGALTISDRFAGTNAREAQSGLTSYTFTQIRHDGTLGGSTTILFDKIFAHDLTIRAAGPQDKGSALVVCIRFNFSTTLSLEKSGFLDQGQGTDWRFYDAKTGKWSGWKTDEDNAKAQADQAAQQNGILLRQAISESSLDKVKKYASASTVNAPNEYGVMPLHLAIIGGSLDIVKVLVDGGADVNAKNGARTPLNMAMDAQKIEIAAYLRAHGAK